MKSETSIQPYENHDHNFRSHTGLGHAGGRADFVRNEYAKFQFQHFGGAAGRPWYHRHDIVHSGRC